MNCRRFCVGLFLCVFMTVPSRSVGIRNLHIDALAEASDVIAVADVLDVKATGAAPPILFHDQQLQARAYACDLHVRRIIKGTIAESVTVKYALPTSFVGYRGLQRGTRIVFLRREEGWYAPVDPYYPDFPAVLSVPGSKGSQAAANDYATLVVREMVAVIASATASPAEKSQILQVEYALPSNEEVVAAFREGLATTPGPELRERLQGDLIGFGDMNELPRVARLLLTNSATANQKTWLLYVIGNRVKGRSAIPELGPLLRSEDSSMREAAVEALWHIADPVAVPELLRGLRDPDQRVRFYAVRALSDIANEPGWGGPGESEFQEHQQEYLTHWQNWAQNRAQ